MLVGAIGSAQRISLDSEVLFGPGEYTLRVDAFEAIDAVLGMIDDRAARSVTVEGHTDAVGSERDNEQLSRRRARAVADYLIDEAGFSADRVTLEAHGESQPVAGDENSGGPRRQPGVLSSPVRTCRRADQREMGAAAAIEILGVWQHIRRYRDSGVAAHGWRFGRLVHLRRWTTAW
ncbi:MAG: OmpA family protein [Halioglobus sp.]|nr:OmpA family protein [Halioglobus sp.]